jgi:uncharacterized protein
MHYFPSRIARSIIASTLATAAFAVNGAAAQTAQPSAQPQPKASRPAATKPATGWEATREAVNQNTVTIVSGNPNGGFLGMAYDISAAIDDGDNMRVLPVVGKGGYQNVRDILHLRGIDMGITQANTMTYLKKTGEFGANIEQRLVYITPLFQDEMHIVAVGDIKTIADLNGKRVNFSDAGSGTQLTVRLVFEALGVKATELNMGQADAFEMMKKGELDATICTCSKPLKTHRDLKNDNQTFKFVQVPFTPALENDYQPITLTNDDYPNLIAKGEKIETIALTSVLAAYNWSRDTDRYRKVAGFVNTFFAKFAELHKPPRNPKWKSVNLAGEVKGWKRFPAAQEWLDKTAPAQTATAASARVAVDPGLARAQAQRAAPNNPAEQERLFQEFLKWSQVNTAKPKN